MSRQVLLPRELDRRLDELASLEQEVNGSLLYRPQEMSGVVYCPIETLVMTGRGTIESVQSDQERTNVLNEFYRRNPDYRYVKFHTHGAGGVREYPLFNARHFSPRDIWGMRKQIRRNPDYIGMLVTPELKKLYGRDKPTLRIVEGFASAAEERIRAELKGIAHERGYDFERLIATRRLR